MAQQERERATLLFVFMSLFVLLLHIRFHAVSRLEPFGAHEKPCEPSTQDWLPAKVIKEEPGGKVVIAMA